MNPDVNNFSLIEDGADANQELRGAEDPVLAEASPQQQQQQQQQLLDQLKQEPKEAAGETRKRYIQLMNPKYIFFVFFSSSAEGEEIMKNLTGFGAMQPAPPSPAGNSAGAARVVILEQPASNKLRFR